LERNYFFRQSRVKRKRGSAPSQLLTTKTIFKTWHWIESSWICEL